MSKELEIMEPSVKDGLVSEPKFLTGGQALMECFVAENVNTIFGYPGGAIMPIYDALYDYTDRINHVLVRHEQGASHAAEGYARTSGKVGVCMATSGPGATNLVTGIADAIIDCTPLVAITGQVASNLLGTDAFQETDVIGITTVDIFLNHGNAIGAAQKVVRLGKLGLAVTGSGGFQLSGI